ncbi:L,D-transpeptidase [Methylocapsa palsarum]|nr:L,D-transpeptidase [Methylocapsa palsarum]
MAHAGPRSRQGSDGNVAGARTPALLVNIDKSNQRMTVWVDGRPVYEWPVSTGRPGYSTPSGTYTATSMNAIWYSKQWDNAPMPHSVFFIKDGHAIHGSTDLKNLGKPVSHGCVRLAPKNAATLYALVKENGLENTQVVVTGVSPGGEYGVVGGQPSPRSGYVEPFFGLPFFKGPQNY